MSNYPPGVTGNELMIAGPDWEGTIERDCGKTGEVALVPQSVYWDAQALLKRTRCLIEKKDLTPLLKRLVADGLEEHTLEECPFTGPVDAWTYHGTLHWTCPLCNHEHEEDQ